MFNNAPVIVKLAEELDYATPYPKAIPRQRVASDPCLPQRLPATGFIQRDAEQYIPRAMIKQLRHTPPPELSESQEHSDSSEVTEQPPSPESHQNSSSTVREPVQEDKSAKRLSFWKGRAAIKPRKDSEIQSWEIFQAIEQKDLMFLMEVRDRAFHLLLRKWGDATPLLHCMRLGQSHRDVAIILLGSFSRWINHLPDDQMTLPKTKILLRALRTNLKLAIDYGLQSSQNDLIASFMQTLIMSEGDKWVQNQVVSIAAALRLGTEGKPVKRAEEAVRSFATKELGRAQHISALEDYVANATSDLVMMAAWHCALNSTNGTPIPTWYFARDDRVYKAFVDLLDEHAIVTNRSVGRRLRWQFRVLRAVMEGRATNFRQKVNVLAEEFDEGPGV